MKLHERLHFIQASRLAPSRKHLVSVIAGFLGTDDDGPAYPSVVTLAKLTSMSEAQVHNLLREMMAESLITRHDGGKRALFTCIRWSAIAAHVPAASGRGGVRVKTPKTGASESAPLDDDTKDWCHETPKTGGWGPKTGAHTPKTAPDQIMIRPEIRPEDQTSGVRAMTPDPHLLTVLLAFQRSDPTMHTLIADDIRRRHNLTTDSRPTMDADPIDNDGDKTPSPKSAPPPSPKPHADEVTDAIPAALRPAFDDVRDGHNPAGSVRPGDGISTGRAAPDRRAGQPVEQGQHVSQPGAVSGRPETPSVEAGDPRRAAGDASTLSPAPATTEPPQPPPSETGVRVVAPRAETLLSLTAAPASKPKRGKGKQPGTETEAQRRKRERAEQAAAEAETMLTAWGLACQSYDTISGKMRKWDPTRGDGRLIAETMAKEGQARIVARFAQAARDPWCLDKRPDLAALCRGSTPFVSRLDAAAEQATLDAEGRYEAVAASVGMLTHPSAQNAPERQAAPKQNGSAAWDDMLSVIRSTGGLRLSLGLRGSTLSHDAGEHKRRCQAVADIGGWAKLCEMGEHNRGIIRAQFVAAYERLGVTA